MFMNGPTWLSLAEQERINENSIQYETLNGFLVLSNLQMGIYILGAIFFQRFLHH